MVLVAFVMTVVARTIGIIGPIRLTSHYRHGAAARQCAMSQSRLIVQQPAHLKDYFGRIGARLMKLMEIPLADNIRFKDVVFLAVLAGLVVAKRWAGIGWYAFIPFEILGLVFVRERMGESRPL
jgi:hypothetical protein